MKHYGDITKINGAEVPIVDIVTGGSPCQDLSVAGKRAGLAGERSGLFMEQIRVIKEMRENDRANGRTNECVRPRFMVWENVPGAFSSNHGEDFRAVLEETAKIADKDAVIPGPPKGKWTPAGCIMGDGWSIAWRVHDAQFWGVPQRRKRISLVADFGGSTAPEILFERKGVSGDIEKSGKERKGTAEDAERGVGETGITCLNDQGGSVMGVSENVVGALRAQEHGHQPAVCYGISSYESNAMKSANPNSGIYEAETARTLDLNGGSPACNQGGMAVVCLEGNGSRPSHRGDGYSESETMYTLNSTEHHAVAVENHPADSRVKISEDSKVQTLSGRMGTGVNNVPMVMYPEKTTGSLMASGYDKLGTQEALNGMYVVEGSSWDGGQVSPTLTANNANGGQRMPDKDNFNAVLSYGLDRAAYNQGMNAQYDFAVDEEKIGTQVAKGPGAVCNNYVVRRLTPMECERLQGFPDHWTDIGDWVDSKGKKHKGESDSPRYKALGNSIALPFWEWMAKRMRKYLGEKPTMASLFDGISGFCLAFARAGVRPVFSSEIEEYPIAVAKKHFGDDDTGEVGDYEQYL